MNTNKTATEFTENVLKNLILYWIFSSRGSRKFEIVQKNDLVKPELSNKKCVMSNRKLSGKFVYFNKTFKTFYCAPYLDKVRAPQKAEN